MMAADERFLKESGQSLTLKKIVFSVGDRIVLHLGEFTCTGKDFYNMPFGLTQDGISVALGITRAHASIELKKLRTKGLVEVFQAHVRNMKMVRKLYMLTDEGKKRLEMLEKVLKQTDTHKEEIFRTQAEMNYENRDPFIDAAMEKALRAAQDLRIMRTATSPDIKPVARRLLAAAIELLDKH